VPRVIPSKCYRCSPPLPTEGSVLRAQLKNPDHLPPLDPLSFLSKWEQPCCGSVVTSCTRIRSSVVSLDQTADPLPTFAKGVTVVSLL
jgi:hypothetical protein